MRKPYIDQVKVPKKNIIKAGIDIFIEDLLFHIL